MSDPDSTGREQDGRFAKGYSGNLRGRPEGARNRTTLAAEALLDGEADKLTRKLIDLALADNIGALRLCLERLIPPRRERVLQFELPPLQSARDAPKALAAITSAVGGGEITPGEAGELAKIVEAFVKSLEISDVEERLKLLEAQR